MPDCPRGGGMACQSCQRMCNSAPCWGSPAEFQALIDAGYAQRLSLAEREVWPFNWSRPQTIKLLMPSTVGNDGKELDYVGGRCTFLTPDGLCSLHALGLKPAEGRSAVCTSEGPNELEEPNSITRHEIAGWWKSPAGRKVVKVWRELTGQADE